ncbi:MAG: DUF493 domain-containing protein [Myxococcota bacterium]
MQTLAGKPIVEYPCSWQWRIIGTDPDRLRSAVAEVVTDRDFVLHEANRSPAGRWLSMHLELEVASERDRNDIHRALTGHRWIRLAL